jgi:hypothetical protein
VIVGWSFFVCWANFPKQKQCDCHFVRLPLLVCDFVWFLSLDQCYLLPDYGASFRYSPVAWACYQHSVDRFCELKGSLYLIGALAQMRCAPTARWRFFSQRKALVYSVFQLLTLQFAALSVASIVNALLDYLSWFLDAHFFSVVFYPSKMQVLLLLIFPQQPLDPTWKCYGAVPFLT